MLEIEKDADVGRILEEAAEELLEEAERAGELEGHLPRELLDQRGAALEVSRNLIRVGWRLREEAAIWGLSPTGQVSIVAPSRSN